MSSLIFADPNDQLTPKKLAEIIGQIKLCLKGRVDAAYIFGSASSGTFNDDSDIDLIIVKDVSNVTFQDRALEFIDLYKIWPRLDVLVYTPTELQSQLADSETGFWYSVKTTLKSIL